MPVTTRQTNVRYPLAYTTLQGQGHDDTTYQVTDYVDKGGPVSSWKRRIRQSSSATSPLSGKRTQVSPVGGFSGRLTAHFKGNPSIRIDISARGSQPPIVPGILTGAGYGSLSSQARTSWASSAYSRQRAFQGLVMAGELGKTINMIRNPMKNLRSSVEDYFRTLKRARGRIPQKKKKKFLAGTWLEYSYGWAPLIGAAQDGAKAFAIANNYRRPKEFVRSVASNAYRIDLGPFGKSVGQLSWAGTLQAHVTANVECVGFVQATSGGSFDAAMFGFDFRSFVPTVWELIPYSFLVDYFLNIGEALEAANLCLSTVCWVNERRKLEAVGSIADFKNTSYLDPSIWEIENNFCYPGNTTLTETLVERIPVASDELNTSLRFKLPFGSLVKSANLLALASNFRKLTPY
jgi:hypothetical protein